MLLEVAATERARPESFREPYSDPVSPRVMRINWDEIFMTRLRGAGMVERQHGSDPLARLRERMPVLRSFVEGDDQPLEGTTVAVSSHLEPTTGVFVETVRDAGATVRYTANDPESVHGDVIKHLDNQSGITTFAAEGMSQDELDSAHLDLLSEDVDLLLTDGAELLAKLYDRPELTTDGIVGCAEQTTSGVSRAEAMATDDVLDVPVFAVNHTPMKHWFDNIHGTGESALSNVMLSTNTVLSGRTVVIAGYGYVGRGVATKARDMGAETVVTEVDPRKAIRAHMDGHRVMGMDDAAAIGDLFFTATGSCRIIREPHFEAMADGALLCNVGHSDVEIAVAQLESLATDVTDRGEGITRFTMPDGRQLDLFADGRLANLAGPYSQGHPAAVMDTTFASMFVAGRELVENSSPYGPAVHSLPESLDRIVAKRKSDALGIDMDETTDEQRAYLNSWRHDDVA